MTYRLYGLERASPRSGLMIEQIRNRTLTTGISNRMAARLLPGSREWLRKLYLKDIFW
jgi:hypothetical protein